MRFLKALFWIFIGLLVAMFIFQNRYEEVTVHVTEQLAWVMKLPTLVFLVFLLTFVPTFLFTRARLWALQRRLDSQPPGYVANAPPTPVRNPAPATGVTGPDA